MTKDDVIEKFMTEIRDAGWTVWEPPPDSKTSRPIKVWKDALSSVDKQWEGADKDWIPRMTVALATLAMALSPAGKKEVDASALYLAAIIVSGCCHKDGPFIQGRVCSDVNLKNLSADDSTRLGIAMRHNEAFQNSGLPLFPLP